MPKQTFFNLPAEKRNAILELAIEEFAEHDYPNASISRLVARAGIAKGSFYQYFEDKRDLFFYLLDLAAEEKMALLRGVQPPDSKMDLFAYLRWIFVNSLQFQFTRPRLAQVAYRALYGNAPLRDETLQRLKASTTEYYRQLVTQGIEQGDISADISPDMAAFVLSSTINELGFYMIERLGMDPQQVFAMNFEPERDRMLAIVDELFRVLQYGLCGEKGPPGC